MSRQIYVNLPVKDLQRSRRFFTELGFSFNEQFSDDTAACLVIDDDIYAMLLTEEKFKTFTPRPVADATMTTEVLLGLSASSREEVDDLVGKALRCGGSSYREAKDYGFMYENGFQDPDGHIWEIVYVDMKAMAGA